MADGVQLVRHDPQVRTVILKSNAPGIFCAGADLKERKQMTEKEVHTLTPATKSCQLKKGNSLYSVIMMLKEIIGQCVCVFLKVAEFTAAARKIIQDLCDLPKPVISALDGTALGGGLEIALATDIRVAGM